MLHGEARERDLAQEACLQLLLDGNPVEKGDAGIAQQQADDRVHVADLRVVHEVADIHAAEREVALEDVARARARLAYEQALCQQVVEVPGLRHGERVMRGADADVCFRTVTDVLVLILRVVALDECELYAAVCKHLQQLFRIAEDETDIALRMSAQHPRKRLHDCVFTDRHGHAERDLLDTRHLVPEFCEQFLLVVLHRDEALAQDLAGRCQRELLVLVAEERHAVGLLQEVDVLRDSRLRNVQDAGRPREIHRLADAEKGGDAKVQHSIPPIDKIILSIYYNTSFYIFNPFSYNSDCRKCIARKSTRIKR